MEVIELSHPHQLKKNKCEPVSLALGYFDGVHLGHQEVINSAVKVAKQKNIKSAVMTFHPHPSVILKRKQKTVEYITPVKQKQKIIEDLGVDYLYLVHFSKEFAELTPQEFVDQYLIDLNVHHVSAGFDYSYGRLGKGTMETLSFHSRGQFTFTVIDKLEKDEEKISSTKIRSLILDGNVNEVSYYLGRDFQIEGKVVTGDQRGRTIGFPTANIEPTDDYLIPEIGVYAVQMFVLGNWYNGVCNVGFKPTFKAQASTKPTIEVHLFQFDQMIYSEPVLVRWKKRIRSEKKFNSIDELVQQIEKDKAKAEEFFQSEK